MNENKDSKTVIMKRRRWSKILGGVFGVFIVLLVVVYFVATSSGFLKSVILPRVSEAANAKITVEDASISPFSEVILKNLKVETTGSEPLLVANEVRLQYHLMDIIGGNINVEEAAVVSPTINVIQNPDGTSNLDPLLKTKPKEPKPEKESKPPQINLKKLALSNATIRQTKNYSGGQSDVTELSNVNVTLDDLKNGATGKLTVGADVKVDNRPPLPAVSGGMQAKVSGSFDFSFAADLKPLSLKGKTRVEVVQASGAMKETGALGTDLECDVTPTDIKQIALRFQKSGAQLGGLSISGPFDLEKMEGKLNVELLALDRQILNLLGDGLDFGGTTINATNVIELSKAGSAISASGQLAIANFQVTRSGQSTPVLNVRADYSIATDRVAQSALIRTFTVTATQNQNPLVRAELSSPMQIAWGGATNSAGDAALSVDVTGLNLADWGAFAKDVSPSGSINSKLKLVSQQGGKRLTFDLDTRITDLSARAGSNVVSHADVHLQAKGSGEDFKKFNLENYQLDLAQRGESALNIAGSGTFDSATQDADMQIAVQSALAKLLAIFPQPATKLASGALDFKGRLISKGQSKSVSGELVVTNLAAAATPTQLLAAKLNLDASVNNQVADVRQCLLALTPTERAKNELNLSGKVDFSKTNAITGGLKLAAESLDLTGYYDMFTGQTQPAPKAQQPAPAAIPKEPEPVILPFQNFTADATIGRLYLREVEVTNFQTTIKLNGGEVLLKPFQMTLNGAPVSSTADLNLGVRGWKYDLQFSADGVPIAPLTDTFSPAYKGKAKGSVFANANIQGAGITGVNLKKSLQGNASIVLTNASIQLAGPIAKALIIPISLVPGLNGLNRALVTGLNAQLKMGEGKITATRCDVLSDLFRAETAGDIFIVPVLKDSVINNWPVNISLARNLAAAARLMSVDTPTNATFVQLPTFVKVVGTIGKPSTKTDSAVIATLVGKSALSLGKAVGINVEGGTVKAIEGVGSLLMGQKSATNSTGTNAAPVNLLDMFKKK